MSYTCRKFYTLNFKIFLRFCLTALILKCCDFFLLILGNTLASLPRTQRGNPIVLGGDPKGKNFLYCNNNSVIIRNIDVSFISCIVKLNL